MLFLNGLPDSTKESRSGFGFPILSSEGVLVEMKRLRGSGIR